MTVLVKSTCIAAALSVSMLASAPALASISASDPFLVIRATSSAGTGFVHVPLAAADSLSDPDFDLWGWTASTAIPITTPGGSVIASLVSFNVLAGRAVQSSGEVRFGIDWDFSVISGANATTFEFYSPTLRFGSISNAFGLSSAGYNIQDFNSDGVSLTTAGPGGSSYQALVNMPTDPVAPLNAASLGGSTFNSYLTQSLTGVPNGSASEDGNPIPVGVFAPVGGSVSSMRSQLSFTLSAFDGAAGSNQFSILPTPGAASLLGLAGLLAARRRR